MVETRDRTERGGLVVLKMSSGQRTKSKINVALWVFMFDYYYDDATVLRNSM